MAMRDGLQPTRVAIDTSLFDPIVPHMHDDHRIDLLIAQSLPAIAFIAGLVLAGLW